mmetsp:Transcript_24485/g.61996  ORF Transcript_24485/g.61996 Transcript_24485/m.61996 type:complete len:378 (+) Transcript_24485:178-1311(+)
MGQQFTTTTRLKLPAGAFEICASNHTYALTISNDRGHEHVVRSETITTELCNKAYILPKYGATYSLLVFPHMENAHDSPLTLRIVLGESSVIYVRTALRWILVSLPLVSPVMMIVYMLIPEPFLSGVIFMAAPLLGLAFYRGLHGQVELFAITVNISLLACVGPLMMLFRMVYTMFCKLLLCKPIIFCRKSSCALAINLATFACLLLPKAPAFVPMFNTDGYKATTTILSITLIFVHAFFHEAASARHVEQVLASLPFLIFSFTPALALNVSKILVMIGVWCEAPLADMEEVIETSTFLLSATLVFPRAFRLLFAVLLLMSTSLDPELHLLPHIELLQGSWYAPPFTLSVSTLEDAVLPSFRLTLIAIIVFLFIRHQ